MNIKLNVKPTEIYVDYNRDCTVIWTNTKEVFEIHTSKVRTVAEQIKNLVSYILICDETKERIQIQNIKVYIDEIGETLKDSLRNMNIECENIGSGVWLKRFCREQEENVVNRKRFDRSKYEQQ